MVIARSRRRITVVTAGHLSTCPRMLRAADTLARAGFDVRVVSARFAGWADETDAAVAAARPWRWTAVNYRRELAPMTAAVTGLRLRVASRAARAIGPARAPWWAVTRAYSRAHAELAAAAAAEPCDLVYGGTTGGLAPVAEAARRLRVPYALDLEDYHPEESEAAGAALQHGLARRVLARVLPGAAFVTTASDLMADAYEAEAARRPTVLNNVFDLPAAPPPPPRRRGPLRLYWFSQTIGSHRGLEDVVRAAAAADREMVITLRGALASDFGAWLRATALPPAVRVAIEPPAPPEAMVRLAAEHDVGLCTENGAVLNRRVCLCNKIFQYLLAGRPVLLSDTPAQARLAGALGPAAILYPIGDVAALAARLRALADDGVDLDARGRAAWTAAAERWHWGHPAEGPTLVRLVERALA
ncbi:MAG: hypothetical protein AB1635_03835 [Acidobacteriota bacterium]